MIRHYPNCRPDYPEKPEGEAPRSTTRIELEDGETVVQCNDCGAYELVRKVPPPAVSGNGHGT